MIQQEDGQSVPKSNKNIKKSLILFEWICYCLWIVLYKKNEKMWNAH